MVTLGVLSCFRQWLHMGNQTCSFSDCCEILA